MYVPLNSGGLAFIRLQGLQSLHRLPSNKGSLEQEGDMREDWEKAAEDFHERAEIVSAEMMLFYTSLSAV